MEVDQPNAIGVYRNKYYLLVGNNFPAMRTRINHSRRTFVAELLSLLEQFDEA